MYTYLTMLAAADDGGPAAGPSLAKLNTWVENNIITSLVLIIGIAALIASLGGKTSKLIAIIGCVLLCGVILSGGLIDAGKSLGDLISS